MRLAKYSARAYVCFALTLPLGVSLHASTIATATGYVSYSTPQVQLAPETCNQTNPASVSCAITNFPYADGTSAATAMETAVDISIDAEANGGSSAIGGSGYFSASATFTESFTFTPDSDQDAVTQIQYNLVFGGGGSGSQGNTYSTGDASVTFDGSMLFGSFSSFGFFETDVITKPYTGGTFDVTGRVEAEAGGDYYGGGAADASLELRSITMLDAQGRLVAGTITDAVPEPAFWPAGLLALGLVVLVKRRGVGESRLEPIDSSPRALTWLM